MTFHGNVLLLNLEFNTKTKKIKRKINLTQYLHLNGAPSNPTQYELEKSYAMDQGEKIEKDMGFLVHQLSHTNLFETDLNAKKRLHTTHKRTMAVTMVQGGRKTDGRFRR